MMASRRAAGTDSASDDDDVEQSICALCKMHHSHITRVSSWHEKALHSAAAYGCSETDMVCRPCRDDLRRVVKTPDYIPRWMKKRETETTCCVQHCNNNCFVHSARLSDISKAHLEDMFGEGNEIPCPTPLCKQHYYTVYHRKQPRQTNCQTCGICIKHVPSRPCPNPSLITEHLKTNTDFEGMLEDYSRVCYSCYKAQLLIINKEKTLSKDSDLQELIDKYKHEIGTVKELREIAMLQTVVYVGKELLVGNALLLPTAHDYYLKCYDSYENSCKNNTSPSAEWILSNLSTYLLHHLSYACKARKYGVLLYRSNADIVPSLQKALFKIRQHERMDQVHDEPETPLIKESKAVVLNNIHDQILEQCKQTIEKKAWYDENYCTINIEEEINAINPMLWHVIGQLTRTAMDRKLKGQDSSCNPKKKLRQFYILCSILFCVDDRCSMPLHVLLADLIESQGGSDYLIQALNRLGICSSQDTLKRSIQLKVQAKHPSSSLFNSGAFTTISVDNIDFLHSFATVFKGSRNSSWHGTTVQLVQPLPSLAPIQTQLHSNVELTLHESRKRVSPPTSPQCLTQTQSSKHKRARTGTECKKTEQQIKTPLVQIMHSEHMGKLDCTSLADYTLNERENESLKDLQIELFFYYLQKLAISNTSCDQPLMNIQNYFNVTRQAVHTEKSEVAYLQVMDAVSDTKDTQLELLHSLFAQFIHNQQREYLVIEGDQKLYEVLQSLKFEYGKDLDWVIPMPGDWHMLFNYQSAIIKPYFDAGLKDLAKATGYPVASIQACSQFKRTHQFLLETYEAIYRCMLQMFLSQTSLNNPLEALTELMLANKSSYNAESITIMMSEVNAIEMFDSFKLFIQQLGRTDSTWRFWIHFLFNDLAAYITMFLAIRSADWHLRTASIKKMAPVFTAFDHINYRKLIARHLADVLIMPKSVITMFEQGAFVVSITGRKWHSVAIDEAHEMLINKACKTSIVRPIPDFINRIAQYLPYRAKAIENLSHNLFPEQHKEHTEPPTMLSCDPKDIKREQNVSDQIKLINDSGMLQYVSNDRGLFNFFTMKCANAQQSDDLLNFRDIGQREFQHYISYFILNVPSTTGTLRKRRLQTFTSKKVTKQRLSQLQKDRNLIISCMHKKIQWSQRTRRPVTRGGEQLIALPLAISDHQGNPIKGQKSAMTKALAVRYKSEPILMNDYPEGWQPQCCLIEGMFLINVTPLGCHTTFGTYAQFLMQRYILPYYSKGCSEVHIVFDNPGQLKNTPKFFEQRRRDQMAVIAKGHDCGEVKEHNRLPSKWRDNVLNCRKCKRALVSFLANYMLKNIALYLRADKMFYIAGAFEGPATNSSWFVKGKDDPQPDPEFTCNGEEADTVIWLHASKTKCNNILIISPDTDVYLIGLPLLCTNEKHILVQVSPLSSREVKLICTKSLNRALANDPDLATIPQHSHQNVIQTLFVVSGCDYISFFCGIGKATFTKHFYQHAEFITGNTHYTSGSLVNTELDGAYRVGFLAFLRLIGTIYFKKHASAFDSATPESYFKTFTSNTCIVRQHHDWIEEIRQKTWDRSVYESDTVPSTEALWRHWCRSCWVLDMWRQSDSSNMNLAILTNFGWNETDSGISIDWDSQKNLQAVQQRVLMLTKGCKCKTGCTTARCMCYKKGQTCLEGCSCLQCKNLPVYDENTEDGMGFEREEIAGELDELEIEKETELDELEIEEETELDELEIEEETELDELEIEEDIQLDELEVHELETDEESWMNYHW